MDEYFLGILIIKGLALIFSVCAIFRILWLIARIFTRNYSYLFGYNLQIRVIALGITSLIFNETVLNLLLSILNFIKGVANAFIQNYFNSVKDGQAIEQIMLDFGSLFSRIINELTIFISFLNFSNIFLGLAFWVFVGQLISAFASKDDPEFASNPYFIGLKSHVKQNMMLVFVLMLSIYFIISAIASLPAMNDTDKVSDINPGKLREVMSDFEKQYADSLLFITGNVPQLYPNISPDEWYSKIQYQPITKPGTLLIQKLKQDYERQYNIFLKSIDDYVAAQTELQGKLISAKKTARIQTTTAFDKWIAKANNSEKSQYFAELTSWYGSELINIANTIDRSKKQLAFMVNQYSGELGRKRDEMLRMTEQLNKELKDVSPNESDSIVTSKLNEVMQTNFFPYDDELPEFAPTYVKCPEPAKAGSGLGPFSFFTSWLMETRSIQLVLIIGMFGFGIFGASISSIIKKHIQDEKALKNADPNKIISANESEEPKPYVEDLGTLVIRGVSATLVVFLAVQGGLVILSSDGNVTPNPYALFLICMIGAVFSEQVWEWAKDKINDTIPNDPNR